MNRAEYLGAFCLIVIMSLFSCSKNPQPIVYGKDACHYCQMTIVDKIHGAEIVTDKGKVFKFDAAECLIRYKHDLGSTEGYLLLTNHLETPGAFVPMEDATFLISEDLPSPMGAFLTAFKTDAKAMQIKDENGGDLYSWEDLQKQIEN